MHTGLFEHWQAEYAARRVATFPVRDKEPAVRGYLKVGNKASEQLAWRFPDATGIGLACKRNKITVLDVDTNDERVLADGLSRYGDTPFVVRSGSGNFQAWYRHDGEGRRIRPDPSKPIDILGDGFVVAPPSQAAKGVYQIIHGSLDDLPNLPKMQQRQGLADATAPDPHDVRIGQRNNEVWRHCMAHAKDCLQTGGIERLWEIAMTFNQELCYEPLPDAEVLKIVASAWGKTLKGENWFGTGGRIVVEAQAVDAMMMNNADAVALMVYLRRHHWNRDFAMGKALADHLHWTLPRFRAARELLAQEAIVECVHPGGNGPGNPPMYRWGKGCEIVPQ